MKYGHSGKDIDKAFCKRVAVPRRETLKKIKKSQSEL